MFLNEIGGIYKNMPAFQRKLERSRALVRRALMQYKAPYVAVSGGKDSIAQLGIVADVAHEMGYKNVLAWSHLSDASYPGTAETIRNACAAMGIELVESWSSVSAFDVVGKGSRVRFGKRGYFFTAIKDFVEEYKRDLAFIGVRAAESLRRRRAVRIHGELFETTVPCREGVCYPLAHFEVRDVAATISTYGLPFHPIYFKMPLTAEGCEAECIRLGYVTSLDNLNFGGLMFLKMNYPDMYSKLIAVKPELALYG